MFAFAFCLFTTFPPHFTSLTKAMCLKFVLMCFLNLFVSSTRKKSPTTQRWKFTLYVPCFQDKILTLFFPLNITISYNLVFSITPTESNTEVSNEELKQQLQGALEVGKVPWVLLSNSAFPLHVAGGSWHAERLGWTQALEIKTGIGSFITFCARKS